MSFIKFKRKPSLKQHTVYCFNEAIHMQTAVTDQLDNLGLKVRSSNYTSS